MKSKISLCNKMLFWKDITRFWPLWALECMIYLLIGIIPLSSQISSIFENYAEGGEQAVGEVTAVCLTRGNILCFAPLIIFWSVAMGVSVFLYLTKEREAYTIHSFPMRRETMFGSHYLAGLAMQVVPMFAAGIIQILIGAANGVNVAGALFLYMLQGLIQMLFFYSLACMIVMLVGNAFMSYVIYGVLNVLVAGVLVLYSSVTQCFVYGSWAGDGIAELLRGRTAQALTPVYAFLRHAGFRRWTVYGDMSIQLSPMDVLLADGDGLLTSPSEYMSYAVQKASGDLKFLSFYLIPVVVFIILAVFLYQKRHLEAAGDMVAFSWGRPVFRIVFVFCASLLFSVFLYMIAFQETVGSFAFVRAYKIMLMLVLFSTVLFYLIGNMILDKTFFIWKTTSYWRMACLVGAMAIGMLFVKNNNFGAKIPDRDKIALASIRLQKSYSGESDILMEEKTQIDKLYKLNEAILKYGRNMNVQGGNIDYIQITYELKGGNNFSMCYPVQPKCEMMQKAEEFVRSQSLCEGLFTSDYEHISPSNVQIEQMEGEDPEYRNWDQSNDVSLGKERKRDKIYQAVIKDIKAGNIDADNILFDGDSVAVCQINIQILRKTTSGSEGYKSVTLWITQDCVETLKALRELKVM